MRSKNKKHDPYKHGKPVTRRDFLAQGLITGSSFVWLPSITSLLAHEAFAAPSCPAVGSGTGPTRIPFVSIDLRGGASIAGSNVMVGKKGGQLDFLSSYTSLGLPTDMRPQNAGQLNTEFGLAFHADSGFVRGMVATTAATTRAHVDGVVFATISADDTETNPFNPGHWIAASGTRGTLTAQTGTSNTRSGGKSDLPSSSFNPTYRPVQIRSPNDAKALVQPGKLEALLGNSPAKAAAVGGSIERLSGSQLSRFKGQDLPSQIRDLVTCGFINANKVMGQFSPAAVDPAADPIIRTIFGNGTAISNDGDVRAAAAAGKMVIEGFAGVATVEMGGFDYHDSNRSNGEVKDFEAGQMIGRLLELAAQKNQDIMIYVFTDGGLSSKGEIDNSAAGRGKGSWTDDNSNKSAAFALVYRAGATRAESPMIRDNRRQIGAYTDQGNVDKQATLLSNDVTTLTRAVVANYLALHGEEGKLAQVTGANPFGTSLDKHLAFQKIRG